MPTLSQAETLRRTRAAPRRGSIFRVRQGRDMLLAIRLLARGRMLVEDLADALNLRRRSAYRLLAAIRDLGMEVERHREGRCVYLRITRAEVNEWMWRRPLPADRRS